MCMPQAMMLTTMATTYASISAGKAQARAYMDSAKSEAEQIQADKQVAELESQIAITSRWKDYGEALSINNTFLALANRNVNDPSAMALFQRNFDTAQEDIERINLQHKLNQDKRDRMIDATLSTASQRATASRRSGLINALNVGTVGIMQIKDIET